MKENEIWKNKESKDIFVLSILLGTGFLISAFFLYFGEEVLIGINLRYQQPTISTSITTLFFSIVFYLIAYFIFKNRHKPKIENKSDINKMSRSSRRKHERSKKH